MRPDVHALRAPRWSRDHVPALVFLLATLVVAGRVAAQPAPLLPALDQLVAQADQIFVGTVTRAQSLRLTTGLIVTDVTFGDLDVLRGTAPDAQVTLRIAGGTVGGQSLRVSGAPDFELGARYLVFARDNGQAAIPLVNGAHGVFRIGLDASTGGMLVLGADGNPVSTPPPSLDQVLFAIRDRLAA